MAKLNKKLNKMIVKMDKRQYKQWVCDIIFIVDCRGYL